MATFIDPASKLFAHMDRLAVIQAGEVAPPVNLEVDISNRCSLSCSKCHFGYTHTRGPLAALGLAKPTNWVPGGDLMNRDLWKRMLREVSALGVRSLVWTGGGEPTLHPDFDDVIATTATTTKMNQGIYTHGGHVDDGRAELMKECMTWCYVSLDNATRESYIEYKKVDGFDRACAGISNLAKAKGSATIGVGFLLMKDNWRDGPKMISLARSLGADYVQFRPTVLYEQATPNQLCEDTSWMAEMMDWVASIDDPFVEADIDRFKEYANWSGHRYKKCWWSAVSTVITPNGKVWECVNKREHAAAELGDLSKESFAEIWARHRPCMVDGSCRVNCRGNVANLALDKLMGMSEHPHRNFV